MFHSQNPSGTPRPRRRRIAAMLGALGISLALVACSTPAAAPPGQNSAPNQSGDSKGEGTLPKVTIGVGGQTLLTYLPTTLADQLGYFEEEGVDVELQDLQGGSKALTAMLGGSTDVTSGYYEHSIQLQAKNQQVQAFVNIGLSPSLALVIAPKNVDTIKGIDDLVGKNVGVTAPGSSTDMFLKYLLVKNGKKPTDVAVSGIGAGSSAVAAVENNQVDAAIMLEPDLSVLSKRLGTPATLLEDVRTTEGIERVFGTATWPSSCLYAKPEWLEQNPETASKVARAMVRALEFVEANSAEDIAAQMPESFSAGDPGLYAEAIAAIKDSFSKDGVFPQQGVEAVLDTQRVANPEVGDAEIDLSKTYTDEYLAGN